jgi:hypothetical protein
MDSAHSADADDPHSHGHKTPLSSNGRRRANATGCRLTSIAVIGVVRRALIERYGMTLILEDEQTVFTGSDDVQAAVTIKICHGKRDADAGRLPAISEANDLLREGLSGPLEVIDPIRVVLSGIVTAVAAISLASDQLVRTIAIDICPDEIEARPRGEGSPSLRAYQVSAHTILKTLEAHGG